MLTSEDTERGMKRCKEGCKGEKRIKGEKWREKKSSSSE